VTSEACSSVEFVPSKILGYFYLIAPAPRGTGGHFCPAAGPDFGPLYVRVGSRISVSHCQLLVNVGLF
jgi:hypothetical protein